MDNNEDLNEGVLEADTDEDHQDPLEVLSLIVGQDLARMASTTMPYDRILIVGLVPDDKGSEVSWSGCTAIEITGMIIYAARALLDHLDPAFSLDTHFDALITEITKHRDRLLARAEEMAAEKKFKAGVPHEQFTDGEGSTVIHRRKPEGR